MGKPLPWIGLISRHPPGSGANPHGYCDMSAVFITLDCRAAGGVSFHCGGERVIRKYPGIRPFTSADISGNFPAGKEYSSMNVIAGLFAYVDAWRDA
ncbi:hypothetical protein ACFFQW_30495 [Umezawaea endophytica]|uniref:Uncharacterized protein n=1 Tax=Umezawaea endophytica TaxID=1654476 RepID=A0A9X3AIS4_9PSEU|nr:hypothetical protein [Umezawaea endophytica]MCS7482956.1 hypothetical protein [Umezawaea endophytica]